MRARSAHQAQDLLEEARTRGPRERRARRHHRVVHVGVDAEVEARGELDGAQDAHRVLAEARLGVADGAHHAPLDVAPTADPVEDLAVVEVVEEAVDGEVAAHRVLVRLAERVVGADEEVDVGAAVARRIERVGVGLRRPAERRDLDHLAAPEQHVHQAEASSDDARVAEQLAHVLGARAGRDVEVLGAPVEQQVAHAAADQVGLEAVAREPAHDLLGVGVDPRDVERDLEALRVRRHARVVGERQTRLRRRWLRGREPGGLLARGGARRLAGGATHARARRSSGEARPPREGDAAPVRTPATV